MSRTVDSFNTKFALSKQRSSLADHPLLVDSFTLSLTMADMFFKERLLLKLRLVLSRLHFILCFFFVLFFRCFLVNIVAKVFKKKDVFCRL